MNPASIMKLMSAKNKFQKNHPKFVAFLNRCFAGGLKEGTIIEITVTNPGEAPITSNIKVQQSDLELLERNGEIVCFAKQREIIRRIGMFGNDKSRKNGLNIIVVGGGKVGATLVERLSRENHDVTLIDKNRVKLDAITGAYDVMGVEGNGASFAVQKEAGIDSADLLISVTDSDELNLLCCTLAKRAGRCEAIARVRTPEYSQEAAFLRDRLGLAMIINPEFEAASEIARVLYMPTALEIGTFAHGQAEMIKIKVPEGNQMCGHTLAEISKASSSKVLICAVERDGEVFIPSGHFIIRADDKLSFIASRKNARTFLASVGFQTHQVKSTMIVGGGRVAYYLAKQLLNLVIDV